ncbi:hypothetical protein BH09ACT3_BH09ACT3_07030 [soil metagenome]
MNSFELLAEPVRRRIVEVLSVGEHSFGEVADVIGHEFGITAPAVSHHLRKLREGGWVIVRVEASNRMYRLDKLAIDEVDREFRWLKSLWRRRYGWVFRNEPETLPTRYDNGRESRRGRRGRGFRDPDPWR